ncbi:phosphopentomutase [Pseudidiomarina terrestris]|uniref:Phosphopentomutase n=1 Tax=Pseudidiomarina terrestris TaxID=2820060 RepID=A0AAW7R4R2_9GAMM|nr:MULTISPECIES: phosphopentomutase [unclassified Pseudidiomarina]MDN7125680.1 phosphopentomutase [Pseudidiomarina sp. 1APP75-32.1]MDN7128129.1 phosphopentomutase [Pseudidiomarina sp. 1APR75-33.1]MDN7130673.1 phosphopentomutase [Pseudidiomarina sp. 1APR75-15]MDN7136588.1 phosphopentomutase [Pseudidiomarina sp. 1ASP75-5]MDN7138898.1 phosphopentomutase [Pseudidiomarina sp. 1ASP75-14]
MTRAVVMVLDSFGVGAADDAEKFNDEGADTFGHIAELCAAGAAEEGRSGPLHVPNLVRLGLAEVSHGATGRYPDGIEPDANCLGRHGWAQELSSGKDTPSGHWEMAGVPVLFDWGYFVEKQDSFPQDLLQRMVSNMELPGYLGNCHASGTEIIKELGAEHCVSGKPIVYTSADSVFQIACHEETFGLERLYRLCECVRELLEPYNIGRVIARPFAGNAEQGFFRTANRRDYAVPPPAPTVLDKLKDAGGQVISIGKIADIFAQQGITEAHKADGLEALVAKTIEVLGSAPQRSLIFTNLVDFDTLYGHRRDVAGYARALETFDALLPKILAALDEDDVLILTADHGCDPTWHGTEHTREFVPVLIYGKNLPAVNLGKRETFADIGQSIAELLELDAMDYGTSMLPHKF